jgi:DDE superfamily endonuclease
VARPAAVDAGLADDEYVVSADEKTSIQCRCRCHPTLPPAAARAMRVEHEYDRGGALCYLAAWDVHRAKLFGRLEPTTGSAPFGRLVEQVMGQEPYRSARRVFWVVDNGSSHRGQAARRRVTEQWPQAHLVHTPVHSSWLNQVEIYLSIVQRKCLTPNDFASLAAIEQRLLGFQRRYEQAAKPLSGSSPAPTSPSCCGAWAPRPTCCPRPDRCKDQPGQPNAPAGRRRCAWSWCWTACSRAPRILVTALA